MNKWSTDRIKYLVEKMDHPGEEIQHAVASCPENGPGYEFHENQ